MKFTLEELPTALDGKQGRWRTTYPRIATLVREACDKWTNSNPLTMDEMVYHLVDNIDPEMLKLPIIRKLISKLGQASIRKQNGLAPYAVETGETREAWGHQYKVIAWRKPT